MVKLADVASIKADDSELARRFGETQLLMLGQRGQPLRLTRERIRYALDKRLPGLRDVYRLGGAQAVQLTWSGRVLDVAALQAWSASALGMLLQTRAPHAEVSITPYPLSASGSLYLPSGRIRYEVKHVQPELAARMNMLVDVLVDDRVVLSVPVWLKVQGTRQAWRVRQETQAGTVLDLAMLEQVDVPLSDQPVALNAVPATGGVRLKQAKPGGSLLMAEDVEPKKPVERGSEIVVRVVHGGIAVEDRALALNEAAQGGRVRLVNPRTQANYFATVVSDGVAEVK